MHMTLLPCIRNHIHIQSESCFDIIFKIHSFCDLDLHHPILLQVLTIVPIQNSQNVITCDHWCSNTIKGMAEMTTLLTVNLLRLTTELLY